jgi:hypothetical protein
MAVRHRVLDRQRRRVLGAGVRTRPEPIIRPLRGPIVGPYAPLLIRLVRRPYALRPGQNTVIPDSQRPNPSDARDPIAAPAAPFRRRRLIDDPDSVPIGMEGR